MQNKNIVYKSSILPVLTYVSSNPRWTTIKLFSVFFLEIGFPVIIQSTRSMVGIKGKPSKCRLSQHKTQEGDRDDIEKRYRTHETKNLTQTERASPTGS